MAAFYRVSACWREVRTREAGLEETWGPASCRRAFESWSENSSSQPAATCASVSSTCSWEPALPITPAGCDHFPGRSQSTRHITWPLTLSRRQMIGVGWVASGARLCGSKRGLIVTIVRVLSPISHRASAPQIPPLRWLASTRCASGLK